MKTTYQMQKWSIIIPFDKTETLYLINYRLNHVPHSQCSFNVLTHTIRLQLQRWIDPIDARAKKINVYALNIICVHGNILQATIGL